MNININTIVKAFIPFILISVVAYSINTLLYIYLPKIESIEMVAQNYKIEYKKYKVYNSLKEDKVDQVKPKVKTVVKKEYQLISNIVLKAIYSTSKNDGWIIISEKSSSTTHILSVGESFKKFKLKSIYKNYVIFVKDTKEYKLSLSNGKEDVTYTTKTTPVKKETKTYIKSVDENSYSVKRDIIDKYIAKPDKIWKDISIKEVYKDGKIDGFEVKKIANDSIFKELGMKKGDIIKNINNIELKSYADAFKLYKNIDTIKNLNIIIKRDNSEMELEYEIK